MPPTKTYQPIVVALSPLLEITSRVGVATLLFTWLNSWMLPNAYLLKSKQPVGSEKLPIDAMLRKLKLRVCAGVLNH